MLGGDWCCGFVAVRIDSWVADLFVLFWFGSLGGNKIGDVGAAKIVEVLPSTKLLQLE